MVSPLGKATFTVIQVVRRLTHYFRAYILIMLLKHPLQALLKRSDFTGRIAKWRASLGAFDIQYKPQTAIKGQVLADFIAKFTLK